MDAFPAALNEIADWIAALDPMFHGTPGIIR
jgi:hypothetical protein